MEVWKDIEGCNGKYQASSLGNIRNMFYNKTKVRKRKIYIHTNGYGYISIRRFGKIKNIRIHRIIAEMFIPNPENKPCVNHKNGIKTDNRIENLEWCTYSENNKHAYVKFLNKKIYGKDNYHSKSVKQYTKNGEFIKEWGAIMDVQRELGINNSNICQCCMGNVKTAGGFKWEYFLK